MSYVHMYNNNIYIYHACVFKNVLSFKLTANVWFSDLGVSGGNIRIYILLFTRVSKQRLFQRKFQVRSTVQMSWECHSYPIFVVEQPDNNYEVYSSVQCNSVQFTAVTQQPNVKQCLLTIFIKV